MEELKNIEKIEQRRGTAESGEGTPEGEEDEVEEVIQRVWRATEVQ